MSGQKYEGSERQKRVKAAIQKGETEKHEVNWDQLRIDLKSKFGSQKQLEANEAFMGYLQGTEGFSIQRKAFRLAQEKVQPEPIPGSKQLLGQAEKLIKRDGKKKTPDSVIAIFDLAVALNNYKGDKKGEISLSTNLVRLGVAAGLGQALQTYFMNKNEKAFEETCSQIMTQSYKFLAADVSLWNAIKEIIIKPALEFLHIDTKRLLSSNDLIKDKNVQGMFKKAVQGGIEIADEEKIDTDLYKP